MARNGNSLKINFSLLLVFIQTGSRALNSQESFRVITVYLPIVIPKSFTLHALESCVDNIFIPQSFILIAMAENIT